MVYIIIHISYIDYILYILQMGAHCPLPAILTSCVIFPKQQLSLEILLWAGCGQGASEYYTEQSNTSLERLPWKNEEGQMATDCSGT